MNVVCTMFEGSYHVGVGALVNSLYVTGYRGDVFVGYRGNLPPWAKAAKESTAFEWAGSMTLEVKDDLMVHFLPLDTDFHFTNYKPTFMLDLWKGPALNAGAIFYFDPDIISITAWQFYDEWVKYGVALIHEVNWNDMPPNHPKRMQWLAIAKERGYTCKHSLHSYINGGFLGVKKEDSSFLQLWKELIQYSIDTNRIDKGKLGQSEFDYDLFRAGDQDLMNLTAMCTDAPLSEMGPESMGFIHGGWVMAHATGSPKPWNKHFFQSVLKGVIPFYADKLYWKHCLSPIQLYSTGFVRRKSLSIDITSFIGRFYNKN